MKVDLRDNASVDAAGAYEDTSIDALLGLNR